MDYSNLWGRTVSTGQKKAFWTTVVLHIPRESFGNLEMVKRINANDSAFEVTSLFDDEFFSDEIFAEEGEFDFAMAA